MDKDSNVANKVAEHYRSNVAIIVIKQGKVLLLERIGESGSWQFPQGGIDQDEDAETAMWRELAEETGIDKQHCGLRACTSDYIYYDLPEKYLSRGDKKLIKYKGQKQVWFLVELLADDSVINLHNPYLAKPEFQNWQWSSYWSAIHQAVYFKQEVYRQAMVEMLPAAIKLGI